MCSHPVSNRDHQRQCKFLSYMFYQAVRDRTPVWMLEDMRTMECFYWEENASLRAYSPSEALLYAVVHDHLPYAQYLLSRYPLEALEVPGDRFCCCPSSAPHLTMAVRYDREDILGLILKIVNRLPGLKSYIDRKGCFHVEDGKTPLHLACELTRAETVLMLLGSGASARIADSQGLTPLDIILQQIWVSKTNSEPKKLCANHLLLFMSTLQFKMKRALEENATEWKELLGEEQYNYLSGRVPATLSMLAMQCIFKCLPPSRFPGSIKELPIPHSLKPLPFAKPVRFSFSRAKTSQKGGRKHQNP
ncbi:ankyrin repeat domain-containing protein 9 [Callorhinchus milii]|uniref:Zgc:112001 n=1 Tax=Callorhinchus milii TaxID=7868 RepID=A0A4W3GJ28_CALMI|nr:ankyrin repeat domain-containing protein 9 [Callorhinchus milii]|eukprot:gi/632958386/ref/XP_007895013.1/ PREDICTED: ankyrin repeat domain-containing protein 9-like [Callorhinchus milii]